MKFANLLLTLSAVQANMYIEIRTPAYAKDTVQVEGERVTGRGEEMMAYTDIENSDPGAAGLCVTPDAEMTMDRCGPDAMFHRITMLESTVNEIRSIHIRMPTYDLEVSSALVARSY